MKIIFYLFLIFLTLPLLGQKYPIQSTNVLLNDELTIQYNLAKLTSKKSDIHLIIRNKNGKIIYPTEITGDIKNVKPNDKLQISCKLNPTEKISKKFSVEISYSVSIDSIENYPSDLAYSYIQDFDNTIYKTVKIGKQTWMAENLKKTHFNNGDPIPIIESKENWKPNNTGLACAFNFDSTNYIKSGIYYTWHVINDKRGVCPSGWHIPKESEWKLLTKELNNENIAHKISENQSLDSSKQNNFGFTAIPSGNVKEDGIFYENKTTSYWWSNSLYYGNFSCYFMIDLKSNGFNHLNGSQNIGMPVRCIKD